jgi:hypothetical protein
MKLIIDVPEDKNYTQYFRCMSQQLDKTLNEGILLPTGYGRLIDSNKAKKNIIDWFMYAINSKYNNIPKDCDELIKCITGWVTYAIDKTPTIVEADRDEVNYNEL